MEIPFSPPDIREEDIAEVVDTLRSGWITTGPKTKQFERELSAFCHTDRTVCLNSATAALELTLRILGIGPGDEVITSAYTYTASASVVCHVGATLVLVDTAPESFEMDYEKLAEAITERTKAVIPVDIAGVMCDYERLYAAVESRRRLFRPANALQALIGRAAVVTDGAHALGAQRRGLRCGEAADFTTFSFHAVKNLTTGEGGAVTWKSRAGVDDEALYRQYQLLSLHGQSKDALAKTRLGAWEYDIVAPYYKCNMTDIAASMGLSQLRRYEETLKRRHELIGMYDEMCERLGIWRLRHSGEDFRSSGHLYLTRLPGKDEDYRNGCIRRLAEKGVSANVHYKPLPLHTGYRALGFDIADYPNAYAMYQNELTLPLHTSLSDDQVLFVCKQMKDCLSPPRGVFIRQIAAEDEEAIADIHTILRECGEDMYEKQRLTHWKTPYPIERIRQDAREKHVYAVYYEGEVVATFQLSFRSSEAYLSKLAVRPAFARRGIGGDCLRFIEELCRKQGLHRICLDVYDKSEHAICFYQKHGFQTIGSAPTRHFTVALMEKTFI